MSTRERILNYTKEIISTKGVKAVSGRKVCQELGINISSIKYHFGDKDQMIREALQEMTYELITFTDVLYVKEVKLSERLYDFFCRLQEVMMKNPDIIQCIVTGKAEIPQEEEIMLNNKLLVHLEQEMRNIDLSLTREEIRLRIFQVISALAFPAQLGIFNEFSMKDKEKYTQTLVNQLLLKK